MVVVALKTDAGNKKLLNSPTGKRAREMLRGKLASKRNCPAPETCY